MRTCKNTKEKEASGKGGEIGGNADRLTGSTGRHTESFASYSSKIAKGIPVSIWSE